MARPLAPLDTTTQFGLRRAGWLVRALWRLTVTSALPARWRKRLRKALAKRRPGPFDATVEGIGMRVYPAENRDDRVLLGLGRLPEADEHRLIRPFVGPGKLFVDIGANVGTYSLWVARTAAPNTRVVAFEPHPRTFAKLAFNLAANAAENVVAKNLAIAGEAGSMQLFSDGGGNIGHASLLKEGAGTVRSTETVQVAPLSLVLGDLGIERIDLLKIDVEGFEDRALLPLFDQAPATLWPRAILIETVLSHLWERDCLGELAAKGYRRQAATAENVLLVRGRTQDP